MKAFLLAALMIVVCSTTVAAAPKCKRKPTMQSTAAASANPGAALASGLELRAGARWDNLEDMRGRHGYKADEDDNPFYLGLGLRLPLSDRFGLYLGGTQALADGSKREANLELTFNPFKR